MKTHRVLDNYKTKYPNPIVLAVGELVTLGEEEEEEEEEEKGKWKGWIWAESISKKGWVPIQILKISADKKTAVVLESYSAKELEVLKNDVIIKIKSLNGWTWVKNLRDNDEGWIPDEIIE